MLNSDELLTNGKQLLGQLLDVQFTTVVTTRMLPVIYAVALVLAAMQSVYAVIWGFDHGLWMGILWLVVGAPALFIAIIMTVRVVLEVVLTIFRIAVMMETLAGQVDTMTGKIDVIQDDLPRIQFWKPRRKSEDQTGKNN